MNRLVISRVVMLALAGGMAGVAQMLPPGPDAQGPQPPAMVPAGPVLGDGADMPPPPAAPAGAEVGGSVASRKSRDPFWPVGYVPRPVVKVATGGPATRGAAPSVATPLPAAVPVARPPDWDDARRHLEIKGISRIGRDKTSGRETYFADVNGRIVEDGDTVSVTWDGRVYRWRIAQISPTGLQLVKLDCKGE